MIERIVIFGAGGLGREVLHVLRDQQRAGKPVDCVGFYVDPEFAAPPAVNGLPIHRDLSTLAADQGLRFVVALGNPANRAKTVARIEEAAGPRFATLIHPSSILGDTVTVGAGSVILQAASVTADVRIGRYVVINPHVSISHGCIIEDYVSIAPGVTLAGEVYLEQGCELGTGATVIPRQRVGRWSTVGAGAVVISPVAPRVTVVGAPARPVIKACNG